MIGNRRLMPILAAVLRHGEPGALDVVLAWSPSHSCFVLISGLRHCMAQVSPTHAAWAGRP